MCRLELAVVLYKFIKSNGTVAVHIHTGIQYMVTAQINFPHPGAVMVANDQPLPAFQPL